MLRGLSDNHVSLETRRFNAALRERSFSVGYLTRQDDLKLTSPLRFHSKSVAASRSTRYPAPSRQGEPFNFSRQVITHTRRSSRFGRPQTASGLRERLRSSIAPTEEFVGVWIPWSIAPIDEFMGVWIPGR